jgi:hypothetical protein
MSDRQPFVEAGPASAETAGRAGRGVTSKIFGKT